MGTLTFIIPIEPGDKVTHKLDNYLGVGLVARLLETIESDRIFLVFWENGQTLTEYEKNLIRVDKE